MTSEAQTDPEYVKALERQIQQIERENRRLKREVLLSTGTSDSPTKKESGGSRGSSPSVNTGSTSNTQVSFQLEDLEDIDLDEVLGDECDDSWFYKSPVRPSPASAGLTPEQWLVQGLDGGPLTTKSRDELLDVRRDLSSMLLSEPTENGATAIADDRSVSPSSTGAASAAGSGLSAPNRLSRTPSPGVAASASPEPHYSQGLDPGSSPVLANGPNSRTALSSSSAQRHTSEGASPRTLPNAAAPSGVRRTASAAAKPTRQMKAPSGLAAPQARSALPPASSSVQQPKTAGGPRTSGHGAVGSRLSGPSSSSAAPASGMRQPAPVGAKSRIGGGGGSAAAVRPSGIAKPVSSQLPRSGLPQPKSGLRQPRAGNAASHGAAKGATSWDDGCH